MALVLILHFYTYSSKYCTTTGLDSENLIYTLVFGQNFQAMNVLLSIKKQPQSIVLH